MAVSCGPGAGMASAVVRIEPEPERLAISRAAAHIVVDRGIFTIIFNHYVLIYIFQVIETRLQEPRSVRVEV
jgi:hypothetical protein